MQAEFDARQRKLESQIQDLTTYKDLMQQKIHNQKQKISNLKKQQTENDSKINDQYQTIEQHGMDLHSKKLQIDNLQHKLNQAVEKCNTQSEANHQNKEFYEKKL